MNTTNAIKRDVLAKLKKMYPGKTNIQWSELRIELALDANTQTYRFELQKGNANTDNPNEVRLQQSDCFAPLHLGLSILKYDPSLTPKNWSSNALFTYPDKVQFPGISGVSKEADALMSIYHGKHSLKVGSLTRIPETPNRLFLDIPHKQVTTGNVDYPVYGGQFNENEGFYDIVNYPLLSGDDQNVLEVTLGAGDRNQIAGLVNAAAANVVTRNLLVCFLGGFLIKDGAKSSKQFEGLLAQ